MTHILTIKKGAGGDCGAVWFGEIYEYFSLSRSGDQQNIFASRLNQVEALLRE